MFADLQKQSLEVFCEKRCSSKFLKIYRRTPVSETPFDKIAGLGPAALLKKKRDSGTDVFL